MGNEKNNVFQIESKLFLKNLKLAWTQTVNKEPDEPLVHQESDWLQYVFMQKLYALILHSAGPENYFTLQYFNLVNEKNMIYCFI